MSSRLCATALVVCFSLQLTILTRPATAGATANFVGFDTATKGTWQGKYGANGHVLANVTPQSIPSYASFAVQNQSNWTWNPSTSDPRALQIPGGLEGIAATWYNPGTFSFAVNLTDGNTHQLALYAIDWPNQGRSETIQILDATTNTPLDTETISAFTNGTYLIWNISGNVTINVTTLSGPNAVISGVFFGGISAAPIPTSTAQFTGFDTVTEGAWQGKYGANGYVLANVTPQSIPSYASFAVQNQSNWTWNPSTSDPRALQIPGGLEGIAATWYNPGTFSFAVNLTDGNTHQLALYAIDWPNQGRSETIQIFDAATNIPLDTETISAFTNGTYLIWNISGDVTIHVTALAGPNAVVSAAFWGGGNSVVDATSYNAPTTVSVIPYPSPIPCPYNGSGCASGNGSLTGAGFCQNPSDFPLTTICRVTDVNTSSPQHRYNTSCDGSSEVNDWNSLDNRFTICSEGNNQLLFSFNPATNTATQDTSFVSPGSTSLFFSYTHPYIMYHGHLNSRNDIAIFSYDTTNLGNPSAVQVVDLGSACSIAALTGNSSAAVNEGISVSGDDQTFGVLASSTAGQGSSGSVYAIAWNRTNGCSYWNTGTGHVFVNGVDQGRIGISDAFLIHNMRLAKGGTWAKVSLSSCTGTCTSGENNYFWNIGTTTVTVNTSPTGCGHTAIGYAYLVNKCNAITGYLNGLFSFLLADINSYTSLPSAYPSPEQSNGAHISWANDNSSDGAPYIAIFQAPSFTVTDGWDNEVLAVATSGGAVYRLLHTYATPALSYTPGSISQDGKYLLWTTDWDGMLGNINNTSASCAAGTSNCRTDVFMAELPISGSSTSRTLP